MSIFQWKCDKMGEMSMDHGPWTVDSFCDYEQIALALRPY